MKKWYLAAAGLLLAGAAVCFRPFSPADPGTLCVAQTLIVETEGDQVTVWGADLEARGKTAREAAEVMAQKAPGTLFLRQVKRIIFCGGAENVLLPREIPMGAVLYRSGEPGAVLREDLEALEAVLEARERRERSLPTLAQMENSALRGEAFQPEPLEKEQWE